MMNICLLVYVAQVVDSFFSCGKKKCSM